MNILVISQYYYPENFRINDICEELVRRGNKVTVVTGLPNYPEGKVFTGFEKSYLNATIHNGVEIIRCKNRPRKKGIVNLLFNYLSFKSKAAKLVKHLRDEFDLVYVYQLSPVMQILPGYIYKKMHSVPLYVYVCDIWPESIRDLGSRQMATTNPIYKHFLKKSRRLYQTADAIGTKCEEFVEYLEKVCRVLPGVCCVNYEHAESSYLSISEKPVDNGIVDFMFLGNIGRASNCDLIVKAASKLRGNNFKIHFVGEGSELNSLKNLVNALDLEKLVVFHGRKNQEEVIDYYNIADVCLLTLSNRSLTGTTPPAKLTGYMAACRPVLASAAGASKRIVEESKCGIVCAPDSIDELQNAMQAIIDNPSLIENMGLRGRTFFKEHFTLQKHIDTLISHFSMLSLHRIDLEENVK